MGARLQLTYADYLLFPEDGQRHEIIEGEHYMTPSPSTRHQRICLNIAGALREHARRTGAGEVFISPMDVVFSDEDVVQPDVLFISAARTSIITEKNIQGPPDLAVEVLSERTRKRDLAIKRRLYEARGVREYWIADPELETLVVYRAGAGGSHSRAAELSLESGNSVETPLLPGLRLVLSEIFA